MSDFSERQQEIHRGLRWALAAWAGWAYLALAWLLAVPVPAPIITGLAWTAVCFAMIMRHVWREAGIPGPAVYVAVRMADTLGPRVSSRGICSACGQQVWVDLMVFVPLKLRHPMVRVLCEHCVKELLA